MKRSMLGTYWTIWSQQYPMTSAGKIVVGSNCVKTLPPSVANAANQFEVTKTTPSPVAPPLGSPTELPSVMPMPLLTSKTIAGGSPMGAFCVPVDDCVRSPGTNGPVGTVHRDWLATLNPRGGCGL